MEPYELQSYFLPLTRGVVETMNSATLSAYQRQETINGEHEKPMKFSIIAVKLYEMKTNTT